MLSELLDELNKKGIEIFFSGGEITYCGPEENLTPEIIEKLKEFKKDIIKYYWPSECKNVISVNSSGTRIPLILLDCVNLSYLLSNYFGADQPVYAFFDNGNITGNKNINKDLESIAEDYLYQLKRIIPNGPFILGGYCFGGILAYEMAIQLQKANYEVPLIILFNSINPATESLLSPNSILSKLKQIIKSHQLNLSHILAVYISNILIFIKEKVRQLLISLFHKIKFFPRFRVSHYHVYHRSKLLSEYRPGKFDGNLLLFKASNDYLTIGDDLGWSEMFNIIKIVILKGKGMGIINDRKNVEIIKKEIEKYYDKIIKSNL